MDIFWHVAEMAFFVPLWAAEIWLLIWITY